MKLLLLVAFCALALAQDATKCGQYPTCADCISHNLCGWCSVPVQYDDGTRGPHCAGKPADPNNPPPGYKPWFCPKDFQNDKCYGYVCDESSYQCVSSGAPGRGVPLQDCMQLCIPPTYECNTTTKTCYVTQPGHGTDKPNCEAQCAASTSTTGTSTTSTTGEPGPEGPPSPANQYQCDTTTLTCVKATSGGMPEADCNQICGNPNNVTPPFAIGDYRGLQVNVGYVKGEWQARITQSDITIADPTGSIFVKGAVRSYNNELWIVRQDGGIHRGIYGINEVPELSVITWGLGKVGASVPKNFDDAAQNGYIFVLARCLSSNNCNFHIFQAVSKILKLHEEERKPLEQVVKRALLQEVNDPCSKYPDCHSCITAPEFCGWCSVPILYNSTIPGKNCAGLNVSITPRINCTGTFSTQDCSHATTSDTTGTSTTGGTTSGNNNYVCDPVAQQCITSPNGTQPKEVCDAQCQVTPVPPQIQNHVFRGLEVDQSYVPGEWRAKFGIDDVTIADPRGNVMHGKVYIIGIFLTVVFDDGTVIHSLWQTQPGPATSFLDWAWGAPNSEAPRSFDEAMTNKDQKEFFFVSCLDGKSRSVCDFTQ